MPRKRQANRTPSRILGIVAASGLLLGLLGLGWGLPSVGRAVRVLPPGLRGPALNESLARSWKSLHERLGPNLMLNPESFTALEGVTDLRAGWKEPPTALLGPIRSFHLRTAHDDEQTIFLVLSRMKPLRFDLNPHFFTYGTAYVYPLGAWLVLGAATGLVPLHRTLTPYLDDPGRMGRMYGWGRLLSVAAFVGCLLLLLDAGRRHWHTGLGLAAAAVFALSPGVLIQSHTMKPPMWAAFWSLLTLWFSLRALKDRTLKSFAAAGVSSGIAAGSVLSAWPCCLYVAAAAGLNAWAKPKTWRREAGALAVAGAASAAAFLLTNPYWLLDFKSVAAELGGLSSDMNPRLLKPLGFLWEPMRHSVTGPVLAVMLAGLGLALGRRKKDTALFFVGICFLLTLASDVVFREISGVRQIRHFLPLIGTGAILAAAAGAELLRRPARKRWATVLILAVSLNLGLYAALYEWNFIAASGTGSIAFEAGDWIDENIPADETLGLLRPPAPATGAFFRLDRHRLRMIPPYEFASLTPSRRPDWLVLARSDFDERSLLEPVLSTEYESVRVFDRPKFLWVRIHPTATTANPVIEIFRRRS
ncbi:MAG: hypothetical protein V3S11_07155 [Elusimicrobiota bacterium]